MLLLADAARDEADARRIAQAALVEGRALKKFGEWIAAQGGTARVVDDYGLLPRAAIIQDVPAPRDGFIAGINTEEVGLTCVMLGGGREKKGAPIDYAVGVLLQHKIGNQVRRGEPLLTIHASDPSAFAAAQARLLAAYTFSDTPPAPPPLIHRIIK